MSNGLVSGNSQNAAGGSTPKNRSKFNLSYQFFDTHRFGEYHPFFVMESVDTDDVGARCSHDVRSYTLKAPLMQDIKMKKDYFAVPYQAILPLNWEKVYTNPTIGDDVADNVGCGVAEFWKLYAQFISGAFTGLSNIAGNSSTTAQVLIQSFLRFLVIGEYVYSNGSLMSSLGIHGGVQSIFALTGDNAEKNFDDFFDAACAWLVSTGINGFLFTDNQTSSGSQSIRLFYVDLTETRTLGSFYSFTSGGTTYPTFVISLREALEFFRDEPSNVVSVVDLGSVSVATLRSSASTFLGKWTLSVNTSSDIPLNLSRLWAYQICCAHFYTNDHVDYIYSANLFREYVGYLADFVFSSTTTGPENSPFSGFTYNGVRYQYDFLSAYIFERVMGVMITGAQNVLSSQTSTSVTVNGGLPYLASLFSYKRSLRFVDYFTGARTRPLAVGDVNVDVNSGSPNYVSVIDVTRNIQRQRFLNAVNRAGRKFSSYMKELFGKAPAHDFHDPLYIGHTADVIFGSEVENTGAAQLTDRNSVTSVLRSNASRYGFEFSSDRDQIILGICYYDLSRNYSCTIERQNFHMNRFDMFNPYMQFIGDQPIYAGELSSNIVNQLGVSGFTPWAYQNRHMEYKQRYNQASGGFVKSLPSWVFLADQDLPAAYATLNPSYIRSYPSELDQFYVSLSGYSLGTYFHFIVRSTNEVTASRPMAFAPSIL